MRKTFFPLLICAALLCGCAAQNPIPETTAPALSDLPLPVEASAPEAADLLTLVHEGDGLTRYACAQEVQGILPLNDDLLFLSGSETTALMLLDPESLQTMAVLETGIALNGDSLQLLNVGVAYFDAAASETVVLDNTLREIRRILAPEEMTGTPLLSDDCQTLYYCTSVGIRALDTDTGISRVLREAAYPEQIISGLLLEDSVLQVSIAEADGAQQTLFLSTETGQLLHSAQRCISPQATAEHYFLLDPTDSILFGSIGSDPMVLEPLCDDAGCWYLPGSNQAVCAGLTETGTLLDLYDLDAGQRRARLSLDTLIFPEYVTQTPDGMIWFLIPGQEETLLCRWDPALSGVQDDSAYAGPRYTRSEPDYDGLAACTLTAQELSEKYGIDILIYKDAVATEPWDYHLEYEYQAPVLRRELERLDTYLSNFPEGFLQTLKAKYTDLNICIVRSAESAPGSGSPEAVNGLQFLDGFDAYIILASDHDTEYALYHELCHLMETVVLTESTAYDRWDDLNPSDFRYDNSYSENQNRDASPWMKPGKEYFIDAYSMSFAREDRARILEYAMTRGHDVLFQSPNLQRKLLQLCIGIREAFELEQSPEVFLWEQYLAQPLAPQS